MPDKLPSLPRQNKFARLHELARPSLGPAPEQPTSRQELLAASASSTRRLQGGLIVPLELIIPNPRQVRQHYNEEALQELTEDIKVRGVLQPIIVRVNASNQFEIIAGERRYRAARLAGLSEIPVITVEMEDAEAELVTLVENVQREDLDPVDEQVFYLALQNQYNYTIKELARLINRSPSYVQRRLAGTIQGISSTAPDSFISGQGEISQEESEKTEGEPEKFAANFLLKESQSFRGKEKSEPLLRAKFNPKIIRKANKTLEKALSALDQESLDQKAKQQLLSDIELLEQHLAEFKLKLNPQANEQGIKESEFS